MQTLLDPPSTESMEAATFSLRKLGAIEQLDETEVLKLTPLGLSVAGIPAPPLVGKSKFGCVQGKLIDRMII